MTTMIPFDPPDKVSKRWGVPWHNLTGAPPGWLREKYWHKYNTIEIPLQGLDKVFDDAVAVAYEAHDIAMLEKKLAKLHEQRVQEFTDALLKLSTDLPDTATLRDDITAHNLSQSASLASFVHLAIDKLWQSPEYRETSDPPKYKRGKESEEERDTNSSPPAQQSAWWEEENEYDEIDDFWTDTDREDFPRIISCEDIYPKHSRPSSPTDTKTKTKSHPESIDRNQLHQTTSSSQLTPQPSPGHSSSINTSPLSPSSATNHAENELNETNQPAPTSLTQSNNASKQSSPSLAESSNSSNQPVLTSSSAKNTHIGNGKDFVTQDSSPSVSETQPIPAAESTPAFSSPSTKRQRDEDAAQQDQEHKDSCPLKKKCKRRRTRD